MPALQALMFLENQWCEVVASRTITGDRQKRGLRLSGFQIPLEVFAQTEFRLLSRALVTGFAAIRQRLRFRLWCLKEHLGQPCGLAVGERVLMTVPLSVE